MHPDKAGTYIKLRIALSFRMCMAISRFFHTTIVELSDIIRNYLESYNVSTQRLILAKNGGFRYLAKIGKSGKIENFREFYYLNFQKK